MVKRGAKTRRGGSAVDQLQAALTRSLKDNVAETVSSVCESFHQAVTEQAAGGSSEDSGGYDQYYNNCRRLVDYIAQNMEASPGFGEQMDRIILACHSGATERVLSSVVTKQLWFHPKGTSTSNKTKSNKKTLKIEGSTSSSSSSARTATRASTESPAMHTRSSLGNKRTAARSDAPSVKRPRRAARKVIQDSSDEEEEEEEEEVQKVVTVKPRRAKKQEEEDNDELLSFQDAVGELCYPDRRSPSETVFFKERLRKSIKFVDALLCKPPKGKMCARGCKKIRAQMCSSSTPCKNKMCRIWHDVEAHTDRCQNPQCEFKNRILLRETMHKLEIKEQQIEELKTELEGKQEELKEAAGVDKEELENNIASVEHDLEECEDELAVLKGTKKTFWGNLNEIGIEIRHDVDDNFPDFATHYEEKAAPRKARKATSPPTSQLSSASSRSSRAAARLGAGPHGGNADEEEDGDDADAESVGDNPPRRTARRSTSSGRHTAPPQHDSDEEAKGGEEETSLNGDELPRLDEPPLPPAGPPPFRQNPELDREFAVSASGYSIHPPVDDLEAPAVDLDNDPSNHVENNNAETSEADGAASTPAPPALTEQQALQKQSEEIADIMEGLSAAIPPPISDIMEGSSAANPPQAESLSTTGFTIRGNQPQNP